MRTLSRAIVAVEDHRFFSHWGIDPISIGRAFFVNLNERRRAQGGSTITQQLARTLYLHTRKTFTRKLIEVVLAFYLEIRYSKEHILDMYMDQVYMGHNNRGRPIKGFVKAAQHYFHKTLLELSIAEQAALVAMLKGPNIYRPNTAQGTARRIFVLSMMLNNGIITQEEFFKAARTKL